LEGWCVLVMGALFGLFLLCAWLELRRALRSVSREAQKRERALARFESEAAFVRELAREAASQRVAALRSQQAEHSQAQVLALSEEGAQPEPALGLESVGRILERLAQAAPEVSEAASEVPAFAAGAGRPALNMVRGGKGTSRGREENGTSEEHEEDRGNASQGASSRGRRAAASGTRGGSRSGAGRGQARDGVKSSSIGSSAIGSNALAASR